jgi:hypothetical protein
MVIGVAAELHGDRPLFGQKIELVVALERLGADAGGVGHLTADQPAAAQPQDHAPKNTIGDADHRRENDIRFDVDMRHLVAGGQIVVLAHILGS